MLPRKLNNYLIQQTTFDITLLYQRYVEIMECESQKFYLKTEQLVIV